MSLKPLEALFKLCREARDAERAFVVYTSPASSEVTVMIQEAPGLHLYTGTQGNGFVFAPFTEGHPKIFIPADQQVKAALPADRHPQKKENSPGAGVDDSAREKHLALLQKALVSLKSGALEKVVLSRKMAVNRRGEDLFEVYTNLLYAYPNAFRYLWHHPQAGTWMGATPETLLHITENTLKTMSLAGTQPYQGSLKVTWGAKEKEEQAMVTRSILKRLASCSHKVMAGNTLTVKAGNLLHLMTPVEAEVKKEDFVLEQVVEALHPTPAVCGLPMEQARNFILQHEGYDRRYYTGYLGPVETKGATSLYVNLRCMEVTDTHYEVYVGGGITKDSDPQSEWEETVNKSRTMLSVL